MIPKIPDTKRTKLQPPMSYLHPNGFRLPQQDYPRTKTDIIAHVKHTWGLK